MRGVSILNSVDLKDGTAYIQINPFGIKNKPMVTISFDDIGGSSYSVMLSVKELRQLNEAITASLEENE